MPQAMASTTVVRTAVARLELTPSMPILARMEVRAANTDDPTAKTNHMGKRFPYKRMGSLRAAVSIIAHLSRGCGMDGEKLRLPSFGCILL